MSVPQIIAFTAALLAGGALVLLGGLGTAVLIHRTQRGLPPVPSFRRPSSAPAAAEKPAPDERPPLKLPRTRS